MWKSLLFACLTLSFANAGLVSGTAAWFGTARTQLTTFFRPSLSAALTAHISGLSVAPTAVAINAMSPGHNLHGVLLSFNVTVTAGQEAAVAAALQQETFWGRLTLTYRTLASSSTAAVYAIIAVPGCCHGLFNVGPLDALPTFKSLDFEAKAASYVVIASVSSWNLNPPNATRIGLPTGTGALAKRKICFGEVEIPSVDEDYPPRTSAAARRGTLTFDTLSAEFNPIADDNTDFPNYPTSIVHRNAVWGSVLPETDQRFENLIRDSEISRMTFAGLLAHRIRKTRSKKYKNERWKVELGPMHQFGVRSGYERYGANAYFDKKGKLVRMYWSHGQKNVFPGDADWNHTKWVYATSAGAGVTLIDHLVESHLTVSNWGAVAIRENLATDHPIRMWMKPFTFRAAAINTGVNLTLCAARQYVHRAWGFSAQGLHDLVKWSKKNLKYRPAPSKVWPLKSIPDKLCPYVRDSIGLWFAIKFHVAKILRIYYPKEKTLQADAGLKAMYKVMREKFLAKKAVPKNLCRHGLVELLAHYIFNGVGFHEHVGTLYDYFETITDVGMRLIPGKTGNQGKQEYNFLMSLASLTGRKQVKLLNDFSHLLKTDSNHAKAKAELARFQRSLKKLSAKIAKRNLKRPVPYETYDPKKLESSVSK